jgi:hypothetical protein
MDSYILTSDICKKSHGETLGDGIQCIQIKKETTQKYKSVHDNCINN